MCIVIAIVVIIIIVIVFVIIIIVIIFIIFQIIIMIMIIVIFMIIIMTLSSCGSQSVAPGCQAELERSEAQAGGGIPAGVTLGTPGALLQSLGGRMFVGWWGRRCDKWNTAVWTSHMTVMASQIAGKSTAYSIVFSC